MLVNSAVDVINLIHDLVKNGEAEVIADIKNGNKRGSSVAKLAKGAILEYPVIASKSLNIADLSMVNKALERQYATYVRFAMSLDDQMGAKEKKAEYINRFHTPSSGKISSSVNAQKVLTVLKEAEETQEIEVSGRYNNDPTKSPYKNQLLDNDVKKANELVPTTLDISLRRDGSEGFDHLLLGVKTVIHPVNSEEMIQNVATSLREKRNLFRFIQWTTGEIKFMKDYVLSVDRLKAEALSSRKDSKWWRALKVKSRIGALRRAIGTKDQLIPNCTLVMSMDEVEYLKNIYDIDLLNDTRVVNTLLNTYFLMGFVIVDPASEMAYFFFDGNEDYQTYSFASLERENSNPQRDLKNMLSLMGR